MAASHLHLLSGCKFIDRCLFTLSASAFDVKVFKRPLCRFNGIVLALSKLVTLSVRGPGRIQKSQSPTQYPEKRAGYFSEPIQAAHVQGG
jgi:hypothetical protein